MDVNNNVELLGSKQVQDYPVLYLCKKYPKRSFGYLYKNGQL